MGRKNREKKYLIFMRTTRFDLSVFVARVSEKWAVMIPVCYENDPWPNGTEKR